MGVSTIFTMSFANKKAWEERYKANSDCFEWYAPFETILPILEKSATAVQLDKLKDPSNRCLVVGCGMSDFSSDLANFGVADITSIDYAAPAISAQNAKTSKAGLKFEVGDCRKMNFPDATYDCVFAKGTIDALLCAERANANIYNAMKEIRRVLKPGGRFICVSHASEEDRCSHFEDACWEENHYFTSFVRPSITCVEGLDPECKENLLYLYVYTKKAE